MLNIGDVVSYRDLIGVVQSEEVNPTLALCDGTTVTVKSEDCTLLVDYKIVLRMFAERGVKLYNG